MISRLIVLSVVACTIRLADSTDVETSRDSREVVRDYPGVVPEAKESYGKPRVVMVMLSGLPQDLLMMTIVAKIVLGRGFDVTIFLYGENSTFPEGVEIITIPTTEEDKLTSIYTKHTYISPSQSERGLYDVTDPTANQRRPSTYSSLVTSSASRICKQLLYNTTWKESQISRAKLFAIPLPHHDLCSLTFAAKFDLPVAGVMTSRLGSWWAWHWLGVLPPLGTAPLPPNKMSANFGFVERAINLWNFWSYISKLERDWSAPLVTSQPPGTFQPIGELYSTLDAILVSWDSISDIDLPISPFVTSMAGSEWERREETAIEQVVPSLRNRNGAVFCNLKITGLWVGMAAQRDILRALATTPFTVVWRGVREAWEGAEELNKTSDRRGKSAILVFLETPPAADLLAHPRHKVMVSMCDESDTTAAILFGSPILCTPVTPDQFLAAEKLRELGLGLVIGAHDVTTTNVREAIRELTSNRSYRSRGRKLAEEFLAQPLSAQDRALFTLENLIRRPYSSKRRNKKTISLLAKGNGDVIAAILVLMTSLIGVAAYVIIVFVRVVLGREGEREKVD